MSDIDNKVNTTLESPMDFDDKDTQEKSFEEKTYILFIKGLESDVEDEDVDGSFKITIGRTNTRAYIKYMLMRYGTEIDIHHSKVMVECKKDSKTMTHYNICISIYSFMKSIESYYTQDDFDIEIYNEEDPDSNGSECYGLKSDMNLQEMNEYEREVYDHFHSGSKLPDPMEFGSISGIDI